MATAELLSEESYIIPGKLKVTEYRFAAPLDYSKPFSKTNSLTVFAKGVKKATNPIVAQSAEEEEKASQLPWLVYLQGGPGNGCGPPGAFPFIPAVLDKGYQVLLLDQRGMGLSSTITAETLALKGDPVAQAEYLKLFRQDVSVKDCEAIRKCLTKGWPEEKQTWSTIGQSYGGFVTLSYLSFAPEGLRECFVTGGLSPISQNGPDEVYKRTFKNAEGRNRAFYAKFPEDANRVNQIIDHLNSKEPSLPDGSKLTPERFMSLGLAFGMHSSMDSIHNLVLHATNDLDTFGFLTRPILSMIQNTSSFDEDIIFAILHEPIYCQGRMAPNWSAHRARSLYPSYSLTSRSPAPFFTPEAVFPSTFTSSSTISSLYHGSPSVTEILFEQPQTWTPLYDLEQLARNEVPVYALVYLNDMYVDYDFSMETAGLVKGCRVKVDGGQGWMHNALTKKAAECVDRLWGMRDEPED